MGYIEKDWNNLSIYTKKYEMDLIMFTAGRMILIKSYIFFIYIYIQDLNVVGITFYFIRLTKCPESAKSKNIQKSEGT